MQDLSEFLAADRAFEPMDAYYWLLWTFFELPTGFYRNWTLPAGLLLCFPGVLIPVSDALAAGSARAGHFLVKAPSSQGLRPAVANPFPYRLIISVALVCLGAWIAVLGLNDNRDYRILSAFRPWFSLPVFALIAGGVGLAGIGVALAAAPRWLGRFRDLPDWRALLFRTGTRVTGLYLILIFFLGFVPF
ncbi:hypothetical protein L5876_08400 [Hyphobacterium sp. SN044]|uniref:hypothetical protein n=1 Tax=Hyphobacterium sp. SN044 TaxID=2912575 RepID=UPI001F2266D3|nr:hypothetical protein [Hyphobacterium sp. SN044]MCF8879830.1 hypothetical protein [Hyphobacterium sp. SN044]